MGIYPTVSWERVDDTHIHQIVSEPGLVTYRLYEICAETQVRTTCFCCSCGEYGSDVYCRNHGFVGVRPCEEHDMVGQEDDEGRMPHSVQVERARVA